MQTVSINFGQESTPVDDKRQFVIKVLVEAPPIPLWKIGLVLLAIVGGGAGGYYLSKRGGE